jgi:hypothetical protein
MEKQSMSQPYDQMLIFLHMPKIGGASIDEALHTPLGSEALEMAQQHLEMRFAITGVLDYYDEQHCVLFET